MIKNNAAFTDGILKLIELYVDRKISFTELRNTLDSVTCTPAEGFIDFMLAHCFAFPVAKYDLLERTFRDFELNGVDGNDDFVKLKTRREEHIKEIKDRMELKLNLVFELNEDNMPFLISFAPYTDMITKVKIDEKLVEMATAPVGIMNETSNEEINPEKMIQQAYAQREAQGDFIAQGLKRNSNKWAVLAGCESLSDDYEPTPDAKFANAIRDIERALSKPSYDETPLGKPYWAKGTEETLRVQEFVEKADKKTLDTVIAASVLSASMRPIGSPMSQQDVQDRILQGVGTIMPGNAGHQTFEEFVTEAFAKASGSQETSDE